MQKSFFGDFRGLSLIEIMVALALFSVGILAVASMQSVSMKSIVSAKRKIFNAVAASGQIERLLSLPYDDPQLADIDHGYAPDSPDHGPFPLPDTGAVIQWEIQDDFPAPGTKRIAITIRNGGGTGNRNATTYQYVKSKDFKS